MIVQEVTFSILDLIPLIIKNAPQYEKSAKNQLIKIVKTSNVEFKRITAFKQLYNIYGSEMLPLIRQILGEDSSATLRVAALDSLIRNYKDDELEYLFKERLLKDQDFYVRYKLAKSLLFDFGTTSDFKFVKNYLKNESNKSVKTYIEERY